MININTYFFFYQAPEMICSLKYDARVDLWSVGVILYGESLLDRLLLLSFVIVCLLFWLLSSPVSQLHQ